MTIQVDLTCSARVTTVPFFIHASHVWRLNRIKELAKIAALVQRKQPIVPMRQALLFTSCKIPGLRWIAFSCCLADNSLSHLAIIALRH